MAVVGVVVLVVGRMEGEWGPSPSPLAFPRTFWRREELRLQPSKLLLSASSSATPAAVQAEERTARHQRSHPRNRLAVKDRWQRRAAGIPPEMPLLPPPALGMPLRMVLWVSARLVGQQCSPGASGPGLERRFSHRAAPVLPAPPRRCLSLS